MQLSNTWKATVGLMIGAILCLPAQAAAEKKIIMRYSHSSAAMVEEPHHTAALDFKKYVEEKTKGRVEVQIYPASQGGYLDDALLHILKGAFLAAELAGGVDLYLSLIHIYPARTARHSNRPALRPDPWRRTPAA